MSCHVRRDTAGKVTALLDRPEDGAAEELPAGHPDVVEFLAQRGSTAAFNALDLDFIRVTEDLIYVLIDKGVLQFTDLPGPAQRKLNARASFRGRKLTNALDLIGETEAF